MIKELQQLHKECFNDSDSYIDYFFNNRYKKENCFILQKDNTVVSALYAHDKILAFADKKVRTVSISGVSTLKKFQKHGYAKKLINSALNSLENKNGGNAFAVLYPFQRDFYEKFNFVCVFFNSQILLENNKFQKELVCDTSKLKPFYDKECKNVAHFERTDKNFEHIIGEQNSDNQLNYFVKHKHKIIGYALEEKNGYREVMLRLFKNYKQDFIMLRTLNIKSAINFAIKPNAEFKIKLKVVDNIVASNNKCFFISVKDGNILNFEECTDFEYEISIENLTTLCSGNPKSLKKLLPSHMIHCFRKFGFLITEKY